MQYEVYLSSMKERPVQMTSPYKTDGNIISKYKSERAFVLKNELLLRRFSLLTKLFFTSVRWCSQESLSSIVTPKRRVCFPHSIWSSPIVTEFSGPMCNFLIKNIASHFVKWGVKEFSRHQLFNFDKAFLLWEKQCVQSGARYHVFLTCVLYQVEVFIQDLMAVFLTKFITWQS